MPEQRKASPWLWVLGGCLVLVVLGVGLIVGAFYWGSSRLETMLVEQTDPAARERSAKEMLGAMLVA